MKYQLHIMDATLTTESPLSHYGIPMIERSGKFFGLGDILPGGITGEELIIGFLSQLPLLSREVVVEIDNFLRQNPDGKQLSDIRVEVSGGKFTGYTRENGRVLLD